MAANKEYSRRSDATRAAKKEFGDNWEETVEIFTRSTPEGEKFVYDFRRASGAEISQVADAITSTLTQAIPAIVDAVIHPATEESTPTPAPDMPQAPQIGGEAAPESGDDGHISPETAALNEQIAKLAAEKYPGDPQGWLKAAAEMADRVANAQVTADNPMNTRKCPECGSEELYTGRVEQKGPMRGTVVDEDKIIGCHHCDWEVDVRKMPAAKTGRLQPRISTAEKPTKLVWEIADQMTAENPEVKRKDVIQACVDKGIAFGTARTQYQHWFKQRNVSAAEPRAQMKDGKIVPPAPSK